MTKRKSPMQKYTIKDFQKQFPDDDACLEWLRRKNYPERVFCEGCGNYTKHHKITGRRQYVCQECGHHFAPTAGTIFHKSRTPLTIWFYTIFQMAQTRGGISAKQIERETGVTYKTAWRMCNEIRKRLGEEGAAAFAGQIEIDEAYFGGRKKGGKRGRGSENKTPVVGMAERKGKLKVIAVPDTKAKTVLPIIEQNVDKDAVVYTDEYPIYNFLPSMGYNHDKVLHSNNVYVEGNVHTNTIEGFWALCKNGIKGVFHSVSPKYLQDYLNEYAFRYNHRDDVRPMFLSMLQHVAVDYQVE